MIILGIFSYITRDSSLFDSMPNYQLLVNAIILQRCFLTNMWENCKYFTRQLSGIGSVYSRLLATTKKTFESIKNSDPRELEQVSI